MTKELKKCTSCNGFKKVMGLGQMQRDCDLCKGIGWIEEKEGIVSKVDQATPEFRDEARDCVANDSDISAQKKRGRPRGINKWQDSAES